MFSFSKIFVSIIFVFSFSLKSFAAEPKPFFCVGDLTHQASADTFKSRLKSCNPSIQVISSFDIELDSSYFTNLSRSRQILPSKNSRIISFRRVIPGYGDGKYEVTVRTLKTRFKVAIDDLPNPENQATFKDAQRCLSAMKSVDLDCLSQKSDELAVFEHSVRSVLNSCEYRDANGRLSQRKFQYKGDDGFYFRLAKSATVDETLSEGRGFNLGCMYQSNGELIMPHPHYVSHKRLTPL